MTEPDPLIALRQAIASRKPVTFLTGEQKPTTSFSDAAFLVLPQPSGAPVVNLSKSIPTRFRKPGQSQTDPTAHPADFYHLDAVYLAWSLREAATAEYMKSVRESGIGVSNMVAITEKQGIVEWLENKMDNHPNIVGLKGMSYTVVGSIIHDVNDLLR
jgi:parafibromin